VRILGKVGSRPELYQLLDGWEQAMRQPNSTQWIIDRLQAAGTGSTG